MTSSQRKLGKLGLLAAGLLGAALAAPSAIRAQDTITIANYGGSYGEAMWNAIWAPIAAERGLTINQDTLSGLADVRAQVRANAVQWDIGELSVDECAVGEKEGLFEPLTFEPGVIDGYDAAAVGKSSILVNTTSYVLAWNEKAKALSTWADFWDVEKFPGVRALRDDPLENIIVALLADGVAVSEAYPPDLDRAFASLEKIKPHISVWYGSAAQSAQLLHDGEVDYIGMWATRAGSVIKAGVAASFTWNQGVFVPDCLFIPKGAPNAALAKTILDRALAPDLQAKLPEFIDAAPITARAYEDGRMAPELAAKQATSPGNLPLQVWTDGAWWAEHGAEVRERWSAFLTK